MHKMTKREKLFALLSGVSTLLLTACNGGTSGSSSNTGGSDNGGGGTVQKKIFVTSSTFTGDFGVSAAAAITAADGYCQADANYPGSGTYKALLANSTRNTTTNWVLQASVEYIRLSDSAIIGTATAGKTLDFPLTNSFDAAYTTPWTGLSTSWGVDVQTCSDWTTAVGGMNRGMYGVTNYGGDPLTVYNITYGVGQCNTSKPIICVEQ